MKRKHLGSSFEEFLAAEEILEECRASALKFKIARKFEKAMSKKSSGPKRSNPVSPYPLWALKTSEKNR